MTTKEPIEIGTDIDLKLEEKYKCCGKPWNKKFMIQCNKCCEWYHGHCIHLKQTYVNRCIDKFYCDNCMSDDHSLKWVFKASYSALLEKEHITSQEKKRKVETKEVKKTSTEQENSEEKKIIEKKTTEQKTKKRGRSSRRSESKPNKQSKVQCRGLKCRYAARPKSKYCSEECGIKVATARLRMIFDNNTPSTWNL